jgi:hypothetical protein
MMLGGTYNVATGSVAFHYQIADRQDAEEFA